MLCSVLASNLLKYLGYFETALQENVTSTDLVGSPGKGQNKMYNT